MPSFAAQQCLFRAYDIRGSRQHFTTDFIQALGKAFAQLYSATDCNPTAAPAKACLRSCSTRRHRVRTCRTDAHSFRGFADRC